MNEVPVAAPLSEEGAKSRRKMARYERRRRTSGADRYDRPRPSMATCFGGGGAYGIGFNMGVVEGLRDAGLDVRTGPMVGTSAGSYTAAALATGLRFENVMTAWPESMKLRIARAAEVTVPVYGERRASRVAGVAIDLRRLRRRVLWGDDHALADLVAASSSPPPFALPHKVARRRYLDGGMAAFASADLAPLADLLILVTPFAAGTGRVGRRAARQTRRETSLWHRAGGGEILHITPNDSIIQLAAHKLPAMFDRERAREVYALAKVWGRDVGVGYVAREPDVS